MLSTLVSHSRDDAEFATRLAADLRAFGADVSLARLDPAAGDPRRGVADSALAGCSHWLVVLSPAAIRSPSFDVDVAVAAGRGIPIVVVLWRDCEIPPRLRAATRVDFRSNHAAGLRDLLAAIDPATATAMQRTRPQSPPALRAAPERRVASSAVAKAATRPHGGRALRALGYALLAIAAAGFLGVTSLGRSGVDMAEGLAIAAVGMPVAFLVAFAGVKSLRRGKQIAAASAQALLADDPRPPVVYLRSFQDDSVADTGSLASLPLGGGALGGLFFAILDSAGGIASEEEQLAEALRDVGPFVAVGKPGEKLPQLGAARMYVQDSEWRDVVRKLMARAALVVLRAGRTDGLWWEVQTAAESVRPERIVFLLPYEREQYESFRSRAAALFKRPWPDYPAGKTHAAAGSVRGIVWFERDGTPRFVQPQGAQRTGKAWVYAFRTALQPVFRQLGVDVKVPKASVWKVLLWVFVFPIVATLAVMLLIGAVFKAIDLLGL